MYTRTDDIEQSEQNTRLIFIKHNKKRKKEDETFSS